MESNKRFKTWYYDAHENVIAEEIITGSPDCPLHLAQLLASNIAETHYPECVRIECLELGQKKTPVLEH